MDSQVKRPRLLQDLKEGDVVEDGNERFTVKNVRLDRYEYVVWCHDSGGHSHALIGDQAIYYAGEGAYAFAEHKRAPSEPQHADGER